MKQMKVKKNYVSTQKAPENQAQKPMELSRELFLIGFLLEHPHTYRVVEQGLMENIGLNEALEKFYKAYKNVYNRLSAVNLESLKAEFPPEEADKLDVYRLLIETRYPDFSEEAATKEVQRLVKEINQQSLKALQKHYIFQLKNTKNKDEKNDLLQKYHEILKMNL